MTWEMFGRWVFAAIMKYVNIHAALVRRFSACTLAYAHTYMYSHVMSTGRFLHSPGHDCICKSVRSGQYCMADTIASDRGMHGPQGLI